jgi:phage gp36-like protein
MAYVELAQLKGRIPDKYLVEALDDDADGEIDAWPEVQADAESAVNALIGVRYGLPLAEPLPQMVTEGARIKACYLIYQRRGTPDEQNPWTGQHDVYFGKTGLLVRVAEGKLALSPEKKPALASGSLIKETAATFDAAGRRLA